MQSCNLVRDHSTSTLFCSDFNIKVVAIADGSQKILKGHTAPVLSVTMDPKDQYIVRKF